MVFEARATTKFQQIFDGLDPFEKNWILKITEQLKQNPYQGKPLGYNWFREKKLEGNRLYYLIYPSPQIVLLVAYGDKKEQREIISFIYANLDYFKKMIEN